MNASQRSTGFYAPALDGLRCLAVGAVMIAHFSPTLAGYADWGSPGVRLFFVLSGFLITHILLGARAKCASGGCTRAQALQQFFVRRAFRLWPLYFASLAVAYAFHVEGTNSSFAWHALFATNHYVYQHEDWPVLLSHYWTLAVEQQFYLVWPLVLLFLPTRAVGSVLVALLALGPSARWVALVVGGKSPQFAGVLLPSCVDFFAIGAIVAWAWRHDQLTRLPSRRWQRVGIVITLGWLLFGALLKTAGAVPRGWMVYDASIQAAGFGVLLCYLLQFPTGALATACAWRPLVFLGQISYGIYILHNFAHRFGPTLLRRVIGENYFHHEVAHVVYYMVLTVVAAAISFFALEEPLRRFGRLLTRRDTTTIALAPDAISVK